MKKRIIALLLFALICAIGIASLSSCDTAGSVNGMTCRADVQSMRYDSTAGNTTVELYVTCYNNETDYEISSYSFKLNFYNSYGKLIYTAPTCEVNNANMYPGDTDERSWYNSSTYPYYIVQGEVSRVAAVPISMTVVPYESNSSSDVGSSQGPNLGIGNIIGIVITLAATVVGIVLFYKAYFYEGSFIGSNWMRNYPDEKFKAALSYILGIGGFIGLIVCIVMIFV